MKSKINLLAIAAILLIFTGSFSCEKENENLYIGNVLFEHYYINYAWIFQHEGFLINNKGEILTYSNRSSYYDNWHFADENNNITEDEMNENLQQAEISGKQIDKNTLKKYAQKLTSIREDNYTEYQNSYDAGAIVNLCYLYDQRTRTYKKILLSQNGDFVRINNHKTAKEVDEWLNTIFNITSSSIPNAFPVRETVLRRLESVGGEI